MPEPMTVKDRLLCADAACAACEFPGVPPNIRAACNLLAEELEKHFEKPEYGFPSSFHVFLMHQKAAMVRLASNPYVFGAD